MTQTFITSTFLHPQGAFMNKIPLAMPVIDDEMIDASVNALRNEMLVMGESVHKFEEEFARFIGTKQAVSTNSGTMALTLAVIGAGIEKGHKVLTTPFTFIATSNAVIHAGAKPVFADISIRDYLLDPEKAEKELKKGDIKGIIPVHLYGKPADMDRFIDLKERYGVKIIEDACQAHGAYYGNKRTGSIGDFGTFSFYSIKNMTVGGDGGMVTLNDEDIAEKLRSIRDCGRKGKY
jgi:perosamine synthetase